MYQDNFTSGELGPSLWRRPGLAQFQNGCALAQNFIPLIEGPLRRRAGFWHNGLPKQAALACRLIPFVRAVDEAYVIEMGDSYTRFWGVDGQPIRTGGNPYEITSPYAAADLAGLRWKQLGNVILFTHKDGRAMRRLQKVSETSWNWAVYDCDDGPWDAENSDTSFTLSFSDFTGVSVSVTASAPFFTAGMVGEAIRVRASSNVPGLLTWKSDWAVPASQMCLSNGRVYLAMNGNGTLKTGNTPPSHDIGDVGDGGINWRYLHDNSGMFRIGAVHSATSATVAVGRLLPTTGTAGIWSASLPFSTFAWSRPLFSNDRGWPTAWPELREERLIIGGGGAALDRFAASQSAGYYADRASFTPGLGTGAVLDDDAIQGFVGDDSFKAMAFVSGPLLVAFTHGGESAIVGDTGEAPLTPGGTKPRALSRFGAADVQPIKAQDAILFVTRGNRSLRDLSVSAFDYPGQNSDISFIARHIANRKFAEVTFTAAPDYILWGRMADGGLVSLVYNREQAVRGWSSHALGGGCVVESLCVVPDVLGNDRLWAVVRRTKNSAAQRMIWMMSDPDDRMRLDGAVRYSGAATSSVTGLTHLNGETVRVAVGSGDGRYAKAGDLEVSGGGLTLLDGPAAEIIAGLPYTSRFESLPLAKASAQGKKMRVQRVHAAVEGNTIRGGTVGGGAADFDDIREPTDIDALTPQEWIVSLDMPSHHEKDPRVFIETDSVHDLTLKSLNVEFAA